MKWASAFLPRAAVEPDPRVTLQRTVGAQAAARRQGPGNQGPGLEGEPELRWLVSAVL